MALLKSMALLREETEREIRRQNAADCYDILESWQSQEPVITPTVALEAVPVKEDTTPFGYDYGHLPSRYPNRQRRWSEL